MSNCPFCDADELTACKCFTWVASLGKVKPECEGCSG